MDKITAYAEIVKVDDNPDGTVTVHGRATSDDLDSDRQICDPAWLKQAMPEWFTWGNVREQHSPIAAGVGKTLVQNGAGWDLTSHVVDANSVRKVKAGVLKGYSIGISNPRVIADAHAPGGRIVGGQIVEVSLVDRPANPTCTLALAKALKPGPGIVKAGTIDAERRLVKVEELHEHDGDPVVEKRDFSQAQRDRAADDGQAMSDGSFPIKNAKDLANAIRLAGNAKDPAAARAHIKRRAAALGLSDRIPDTWKALAAVDGLVKGVDLVAVRKGDVGGQIADARQARALIAGLIQAEATYLADGSPTAVGDIELLVGAAKGLDWFCSREEEAAMAHVELSDTPDVEKAAAPVAVPAVEKAKKKPVPADDDESTETENETDDEDDAAKSATPTTPDLTELVKAAVAEATAPLKEQLAKALAAPQAGGPVLTRTQQDTNKAAAREGLLTKAAEYEATATQLAGDPSAQRAYRSEAKKLRDQAALTS